MYQDRENLPETLSKVEKKESFNFDFAKIVVIDKYLSWLDWD